MNGRVVTIVAETRQRIDSAYEGNFEFHAMQWMAPNIPLMVPRHVKRITEKIRLGPESDSGMFRRGNLAANLTRNDGCTCVFCDSLS